MGNTEEVDLTENAIYIVSGGNITKIDSKEHGQDVVHWKNGEVLDIEERKRTRIKRS